MVYFIVLTCNNVVTRSQSSEDAFRVFNRVLKEYKCIVYFSGHSIEAEASICSGTKNIRAIVFPYCMKVSYAGSIISI